MIEIRCRGASADCIAAEVLTSGMVGRLVRFTFDEAWEGLSKTAVFIGVVKESMLLQENIVEIPAPVLLEADVPLVIGVRGESEDGTVVIPTVYVHCGTILPGADTVPVGTAVTPSQAQQLQSQIDELKKMAGGGASGGAVSSVNGQTGAVVLDAADVGALPDTAEIPTVPAALPNPNKLTFTGAVEAEYDGSAAVSVEIPAGGSGDDGSWRTIADITTEEEIDCVFITQDSGGNAFALTDFVVFVNALANEAGTTSGYFRFGVNPKDAHDYIWQPNGGVTASGYRWYQARFTLLGDKWYCADMIGQFNTSFDFAGGYITRLPDSYSVKTPAAAVVINFMANVGVGTRIMVYGK